MKLLLRLIFAVTFFYACNDNASEQSTPEVKKDSVVEPSPAHTVNNDSTIATLTRAVLQVFNSKKYDSLVSFIHPVEGVRFSPYGFIDSTSDVRLSKERFTELLAKQSVMVWGSFDGSGDPIRLTLPAYLQRFVYDVDFLHPEKLRFNEATQAGNTSSNIALVYPGALYTESYFSGFDKKYSGMDWRALRLVFKLYGDQYYLVAVIHDQWTV